MTIREPVEELRESVLEFQALWSRSISGVQDPLIGERLERCMERIWLLIRGDLLDLAARWLRSGLGRDRLNHAADLEDAKYTLALIAFRRIFHNLPTIEIDPARNVTALLRTIGKRGLYDENRDYLPDESPAIRQLAENQATLNRMDFFMWEPHDPARQISASMDLADPSSFDWEDRLLASLNKATYTPAIHAAIRTLTPEDQLAIIFRHTDPPTPYQLIASVLNEKEPATRQRYSRALRKMRRYFMNRGITGMEDAGDIVPAG